MNFEQLKQYLDYDKDKDYYTSKAGFWVTIEGTRVHGFHIHPQHENGEPTVEVEETDEGCWYTSAWIDPEENNFKVYRVEEVGKDLPITRSPPKGLPAADIFHYRST